MYGPIQRYAEANNILNTDINYAFQREYVDLAKTDLSEAHLLSKQMDITPSDETLNTIFKPIADEFINDEFRYKSKCFINSFVLWK